MIKQIIKFIGELFVQTLPPIILFFATFAASKTDVYQAKPETYLLSTILGFCITIWVLQYKKNSNVNVETPEFEYFVGDKEKINAVKSLYATRSATIYSTHIYADYEPLYGRKDVAYPLYSKNGINTKFVRIVSVNTVKHKEWVRNMLENSKNKNFELYVIEKIPSRLFFPNFVIVISDRKKRLFISFRSDGASGNFAFSTSNTLFLNGLHGYATFLARQAEPAKDAIKRW